jgi:hypothetical protein
MQEFATVSASSYDPAALAAKLNEKSAEGWTVAAIVPTGGDVTAFLCREATGDADEPAAETGAADTAVEAAAPAAAAASMAEPAGWASAPEPVAPAPVTTAAPVYQQYQPAPSYEPAPAPAPTPSTSGPAPDWYADPAGRFELRYWDGSKWTEHVSRGGQQFNDPPFA